MRRSTPGTGTGSRAASTRSRRRLRDTSGDGRHMFGATVTLADVCIVPQMYNARRQQCDVAPYPRLRAICAHLEGSPAFARAAPEAQPDAPGALTQTGGVWRRKAT